MTYRLDVRNLGERFEMVFQGVLDRAALLEIRARATEPVLRGRQVRLVLLTRTDVDGSCIGELGRLSGVEVFAQDPYLRHWLASCE